MPKITIFVGLPAAGKSEAIKRLPRTTGGVYVEDFMANSIEHSERFTQSRHYVALVEALRAGHDCVIADVAYCDTWRRIEVEQVIRQDVVGIDLCWIFFENDLKQCKANIEHRNRPSWSDEIVTAEKLSARYFVPNGAVVRQVVRANESK